MPKISELTAATSVSPSDLMVIVQSGETKQAATSLVSTYAITTQESNSGITPTNYNYEPGDVRRYGAVGDGITNDSTAIQSALSSGHNVIFQNKTYYIASGLSWNADNSVIFANGAILTTDQDIIGLTVGSLGSGNIIWNPQIRGYLYFKNTLGAGSSKQGMLLRHSYEGVFEVSFEGWHTAVELTSDAHGCVYNSFYFGRVYGHNTYGVYLRPTLNGWVNENNFYNGRFGIPASYTSGWHIYMPDSGSTYGQPNNNKFYGLSLEMPSTSTMDGLYLDGGYQNFLAHPRCEAAGTLNDHEIRITEDAIGACILFPYGLYQAEGPYQGVLDEGRESVVFTRDRLKFVARQAGAAQVMELWRDDGNADGLPMLEIGDTYNESQASMGILLRLARDNGTPGVGYAMKVEDMGSIRLGADGKCYECILSHTSSAADEPGVGANWETYWRLLPTKSSTSISWAVSTGYTGVAEKALIRQRGDAVFRTMLVTDAAEAAPTGDVMFGTSTQTTVGAAGAASALPATPSGYLKFYIGSTQYVIPYYAQA